MKVVKSFLQNFTMVFYPEDSVIMTQRAVGCCRLAGLICWCGHCGGELAVVCGAVMSASQYTELIVIITCLASHRKY